MAEHPVVAVAGEVLTDLVPGDEDGAFRAAPGGSPGNVAVGLARLGVPARMLARLSSDLLGRRLRAHLDRNGVDLSYAVAAREPSSLALVALRPDGSAEYDFRLDGTADWQWSEAELRTALDGAAALCLGSLATVLEPGGTVLRDLARRARPTATVVYDPNLRPAVTGLGPQVRAAVDELVGLADVVKVSEEDLAALEPGRPVLEVTGQWLARGPSLVAVTLGGQGAAAVAAGGALVRRPGRRVEVIDTVGAGDSFQAALVHGLGQRGLLGTGSPDRLRSVDGATLSELLDHAIAAAAITCSRRGADPPTGAELTAAYAVS